LKNNALAEKIEKEFGSTRTKKRRQQMLTALFGFLVRGAYPW
jgi:hypothetical protein